MSTEKKRMMGNNLWLATALVLVSGCASGVDGPSPSASDVNGSDAAEAASRSAQDSWVAQRHQAQRAAEAQVSVLAQARLQLLSEKPLGIQRDAAICFEARRMMDSRLEQAMRSGGEFGPALDTWHAQSRGVETFCAYALTVGAPR